MSTEPETKYNDQVKPEDRDWQLDKGLVECMFEMYERQLFTDVTFTFQQKVPDEDNCGTLGAHKNILAARSPVFQAMFYGPCADGKSTVEIKEVDKHIMDIFLRYLYSEHAELQKDTVNGVIEIAHAYQVPKAVNFCSYYIIESLLSTDNSCSYLEFALLYEITDLRDAACRLIDENGENALGSESFLQISKSCLVYILKGDTIEAKEDYIYERCIAWAKNVCKEDGNETLDGKAIREILGEAFYFIRIPTMDMETLFSCTTERNPYTLSEYERVVEKIYGHDIFVSSNSSTERGTLTEYVSRKEKCGFSTIPCNKGSQVDVLVSRECILKGLKLIPPTTTYVEVKEFGKVLQLMKFIIQIPELSFEKTVPMQHETVLLHVPLIVSCESKKVSICVKADLSVLPAFLDAVYVSSFKDCCGKDNYYRTSALKVSTSKREERVSGRFGEVIFKEKNSYIDSLVFEHISNR